MFLCFCLCYIGMAFGTGSAVAHRAVDSVMGPRTIQHEAVPAAAGSAAPELSKDACGMHLDAFTKVCYVF